MGQQYLAGALLNHFEGLYVQSFDLPTLLSDSTRSSEAAVVQLFTEVRRHKPAVIYIPNVDVWYRTVGQAVISTFLGLLRTLSPTDPVLLLGILECPENEVDPHMIKDLFGYSRGNQYSIQRPERVSSSFRVFAASSTDIFLRLHVTNIFRQSLTTSMPRQLSFPSLQIVGNGILNYWFLYHPSRRRSLHLSPKRSSKHRKSEIDSF